MVPVQDTPSLAETGLPELFVILGIIMLSLLIAGCVVALWELVSEDRDKDGRR